MVFLGKKVGLALTLSTQWCEKVADNCLGYLKNLCGGGGKGGVSALNLHPIQEEENGNIPCCLKLWQPGNLWL